MAGVNKAIILGNLGADPELRNSSGGLAICKLRIATNERVKRGDEWEDHTEWHRVTCFGTTAENAAKYLEKGRQVYIEGKFRTSKYEDDAGVEKFSTEILADVVVFIGGDSGGGEKDRGGRERDDDRGRDRGRERDDDRGRDRDDRGGRSSSRGRDDDRGRDRDDRDDRGGRPKKGKSDW